MAKNNYGTCSLCRKYGRLSYEHIPPKSSFNSRPVHAVTGETLLSSGNRLPWDFSGMRYENLQQGIGRYSLCSKCNNDTGAWYGNEYTNLASAVHSAILSNVNSFVIEEFYPLRFAKQVLSMFCSINSDCPDNTIGPLREIVLDKQKTGLDRKKYKLCMYFTKSALSKQAGISVVGNIQTGIFTTLSEITGYPLGFALYFDPVEGMHYNGFDITGFTDFQYDQKGRATFPLYLLEMNSWLPADYRSQDEIRLCIEKNEEREQDNGMDII